MTFYKVMSRLPIKIAADLRSTPQSLLHHPEGNAFEHTKQVFEKTIEHFGEDIDMQLAAIFRDLGKIECTFLKDGRIVAYGHELRAKEYIEKYKHLFDDLDINWDRVKYVCRYHMLAHRFEEMRKFKLDALKESPYFDDLVLFAKCDNEGRVVRDGQRDS